MAPAAASSNNDMAQTGRPSTDSPRAVRPTQHRSPQAECRCARKQRPPPHRSARSRSPWRVYRPPALLDVRLWQPTPNHIADCAWLTCPKSLASFLLRPPTPKHIPRPAILLRLPSAWYSLPQPTALPYLQPFSSAKRPTPAPLSCFTRSLLALTHSRRLPRTPASWNHHPPQYLWKCSRQTATLQCHPI